MSVRAYKVIEIKIEDDPTFNLWRDNEITNLLDLSRLNDDGVGIFEVSKEDIEDARRIITTDESIDTERKRDLFDKLDRMQAEAGDDNLVQYYCF